MPRNPRKQSGRKRGYRRFIGLKRKGVRFSGQGDLHKQRVTSSSDNQQSPAPTQERDHSQSMSDTGFRGFNVSPNRRPIVCLSVFDGISCGLVSLEKLGIPVQHYYSSEINEDALAIQKKKYPFKVTRVGDVTKLDEIALDKLSPISLLIGGSPCNDLSRVNPLRRGLHGENSTGNLFFEYIRILKYLQKVAQERKETLYYLFENTANLDSSALNEMRKAFGTAPSILCASNFVPMRRKRLFFHNLPANPEDSKQRTVPPLSDFLDVGREALFNILPTVTGNASAQKIKMQYPICEDEEPTLLNVHELERLFGLPEGYTDNGVLSVSRRRKLIGKSWATSVITYLLKPLQDLF